METEQVNPIQQLEHEDEFMSASECAAFEKTLMTLELLKSKAETETLKLDLLKMQIKAKYKLSDQDKVDFKTGLISRA